MASVALSHVSTGTIDDEEAAFLRSKSALTEAERGMLREYDARKAGGSRRPATGRLAPVREQSIASATSSRAASMIRRQGLASPVSAVRGSRLSTGNSTLGPLDPSFEARLYAAMDQTAPFWNREEVSDASATGAGQTGRHLPAPSRREPMSHLASSAGQDASASRVGGAEDDDLADQTLARMLEQRRHLEAALDCEMDLRMLYWAAMKRDRDARRRGEREMRADEEADEQGNGEEDGDGESITF
ncbi:hypothetical protein QBC39DRAFT_362211 [Podospora conica]|nr:hypothetical protein QBC39DRAFT_362211 [Schizothecium conicum]